MAGKINESYYGNYYPNSIKVGQRDYQEYFQWSYEVYCYKTPEHYDNSVLYKGDMVDGKLITRIYKRDGSFFENLIKVPKEVVNFKRAKHNNLSFKIYIPYSGKEIRLEVRRINKKKNEDVLLYEKEIPDFNSIEWGFSEKEPCHQSIGSR